MGAWVVDVETAKRIVAAWLQGRFAGGRHVARLEKIAEMEKTARPEEAVPRERK